MHLMFRPLHRSFSLLLFTLGIIFGDLILLLSPDFSLLFNSFLFFLLALIFLLLAILKPQPIFLFLAFCGGFFLINTRASPLISSNRLLSSLIGQNLTLSGTVFDDPTTTKAKTALKLQNLCLLEPKSSNRPNCPFHSQTLLYVKITPNKRISRFDHLVFQGELQAQFGTFPASFSRPKLLSHTKNPNFLLQARNHFAKNLQKSLQPDPANLGLGYLLGIKSNIKPDLLSALSLIGLTHIIVASGTHLSILITNTKRLTKKISKNFSLFASLFVLFFFIFLIGDTPSMARAGLVATLTLIFSYFGRQFKPLKLIILTMSITLLKNPLYPLSLGWQLSFASYIGILLLTPKLTKIWYQNQKPTKLGSILIPTLSATLTTSPIIAYNFGSLSLLTPLANLLILPTIPIALALLLFTGTTASLSFAFFPSSLNPFLFFTSILVHSTNFLLNLHINIALFLSNQTPFIFNLPQTPLLFLIYLPLLIIIFKPSQKPSSQPLCP